MRVKYGQKKEKRIALCLEQGGPVKYTEAKILIKQRAVMFKLLDNILVHAFIGSHFVDK